MGEGTTVSKTDESQEDWPADRYERVALIAEKQEFVFLSQIRDYLTHNASF